MKNLKILILLVLSPLTFFGQQLSGLWTGALSNDSTSVRQDQSFEIALTEYKGKVYGYSRSTFIVNDTLYYIVKRVKGTIESGVCEVKDDEIVSCNFPKRLEKGVKVIHTFRMNQTDSSWQLDGNWKTTQTKKYYSLTGRSDLAEEKNFDNSKIFPHLEELDLAKEIPFYVADKKVKQEIIAKQIAADRNKPTAISPQQQAAINSGVAINKPAASVKTNTIAVDNNIIIPEEKVPATSISTEQQATAKKDVAINSPANAVKTNTVAVDKNIVIPEEKVPATGISTEQQATAKKDVAINSPANAVKTNTVAVDKNIVIPEEKTPATNIATEQQKGTNKTDLANRNAANVKTATVPVNNTIALPGENKPQTTVAANEQTRNSKPDLSSSKPNAVPVKATPANNSIATVDQGQPQSNGQAKTQPVVNNNKQDVAVNNKPATTSQQPAAVINDQNAAATKTTATAAIPETSLANKFDALKNFKPDASGAAAHIAERKTDAQQTILFKADSLMIAVYDNGEVDGDTVSVLLNGEVVMAKQGLKASASKKTIYLPATADGEFTLVLYAENLGKYPPNTGLLVVYDGDERHYVRFSADLQKNAGVLLKRKK